MQKKLKSPFSSFQVLSAPSPERSITMNLVSTLPVHVFVPKLYLYVYIKKYSIALYDF